MDHPWDISSWSMAVVTMSVAILNNNNLNKVHIKVYWLTKCENKNHSVNGYVSHNHLHIHASSSGMADVMIFYCYLHIIMRREG